MPLFELVESKRGFLILMRQRSKKGLKGTKRECRGRSYFLSVKSTQTINQH